MQRMNPLNRKGVTLIELLMALVILGILITGIYRVFIAQSKAYMTQDQVVEIQQSVRSAMEILSRDLRMAGFDDDHLASTISITDPIAHPIDDHAIAINYEDYDHTLHQFQKHTVVYWKDADASTLIRQLTINGVDTPQESLLENVEDLVFLYGVDSDGDGTMDCWASAKDVEAPQAVVAVRVILTARPAQGDTDLPVLSPRTLDSVVYLRNASPMR